jgi:cytochrome o ubiquinol oxidase subunit 2
LRAGVEHTHGCRIRDTALPPDAIGRSLAHRLIVPERDLCDVPPRSRSIGGDQLGAINLGRHAERLTARFVFERLPPGDALSVCRTLRTATPFICLPLGGCAVLDRGFLLPAGPVAAATRHEFLLVCLVMLFVIAPVLALAPLFAWHYRLSNTRSAYRPQWGFSWPLEGLIWIPPSLIVVGLAFLLWRDTHQLDPYKPLPGRRLDIEAVAMDWKWLFIYPAEGVALVNRLVIPAGRPVHLSLTSATVMQSILMPRLAGQIYAMAGMRTQLNFAAGAPGSFRGENTQFNGMGFQNQTFAVTALDARDFARWLAETRAQPDRLDAAEYEILSRRSTLPDPLAFGAVDPDLFGRILALAQPSGQALALKRLPPAPRPMDAALP